MKIITTVQQWREYFAERTAHAADSAICTDLKHTVRGTDVQGLGVRAQSAHTSSAQPAAAHTVQAQLSAGSSVTAVRAGAEYTVRGAGSVPSVGLVPSMGALHDGHLSLFRKCRAENDIAVATIFVNPTQFNNPDDLSSYPSSFEQDSELASQAGIDVLFAPSFDEMYPDGYETAVIEKNLSKTLCGASRPGHFDGVLTVVLKLLNIFNPDRAYFGEKDYQQYLLIDKMGRTFFLRTHIIPCPLIREESGLALSSRNRRLSSEGKKNAPLFYKALSSGLPLAEIRKKLEHAGFIVDYVEQVHGRVFGAVFLEGVRLIDNVSV